MEAASRGERTRERLKAVGFEALRQTPHYVAVGVTQVNFQVIVLRVLVSYPDGFARPWQS